MFATNPDFKYFAALHLFSEGIGKNISIEQLQMDHFNRVGYKEVKDMINNAANNRVDPDKLRQWCQDSTLSFEGVLNKMFEENKRKRKPTAQTLQEANTQNENAKRIIKEYSEKANVDFKDIPRSFIPSGALQFAMDSLKENDLTIFPIDLQKRPNEIEKYFKTNPSTKLLVHQDSSVSPCKLTLYYFEKDGAIKNIEIDYLTKPGFLKVGDEFLKAAEILSKFSEF